MDTTTFTLNKPLPVFRLEGKVALITGGGGRIGVETARRLLREGASVSLVDISAEALESAVAILKNTLSTGQSVQSRILTVVADVTVEAEVKGYTNKTVGAFGRLDVAFLNAGISYAATSIFDTKEEDYEKVMCVNVKSGKFIRVMCGRRRVRS